VTSQVSHPYNSTDFTQALNILILLSSNKHSDWKMGWTIRDSIASRAKTFFSLNEKFHTGSGLT